MADSRRVGVAVDFSPCSKKALKWAVDNIVRSGDHLILITVRSEGNYEEGEMQLWEATGSRLNTNLNLFLDPAKKHDFYSTAGSCPSTHVYVVSSLACNLNLVALIPLSEFSHPHIMKKYGVNPHPETLDILTTAARQKEIVVVLKIYWGDAREKIVESVDNIPLDCLVIGNRGLGKIKRVLMGSVSNYVVNSATCPVTVVKSHD